MDEFLEIVTRWKESSGSSRSYHTMPWKVSTDIDDGFLVAALGTDGLDGKDYYIVTDGVHASELSGGAKGDAELIVHAPSDIKRLGAELNEAWNEIDQLKLELAALKLLHGGQEKP